MPTVGLVVLNGESLAMTGAGVAIVPTADFPSALP
jgi:hypothetical protein